jgi:hypothetical protein|tara:strand:- start:189 stop:443 length:255 start_codon:yes stop_codon:yes gene_type:complete
VHRLCQLGRTYSLVDAVPTPDAICAAIRAGRVEVRARPVSLVRIAALLAAISIRNFTTRLRPAADAAEHDADPPDASRRGIVSS